MIEFKDKREMLAWMAGIVEGEGCFTIHKTKKNRNAYPQFKLSMCDLDVVETFVHCLREAGIKPQKIHVSRTNTTRKPIYQVTVWGFEKVQALAAMLWVWLGERRRERIAEVLSC